MLSLKVFVKNKLVVVGALIVLVVLVLALLAPWVTRYDPLEIDVKGRFTPPGGEHWFGTDYFGRDIWSRILYGTRASLYVSITTVILSVLMGTITGLISGYFGGAVDNIIMRFYDGILAFPPLLLAIGVSAVLGAGLQSIIIALAVIYTPRFARVTRSSVLSIREMEYIEGARAQGANALRILALYVLPNCLAPIIVQATAYFAQVITVEAALSFLGLGEPPPAPTLGNILSEGRNYIRYAPWITIFPGVVITVLVLGLNLLGDTLRDLLDPRLRGLDTKNK